MHDFHWRNFSFVWGCARTIDNKTPTHSQMSVHHSRVVSRSPEERVHVRSSESLSCSLHFSVTLICRGRLSSLSLSPALSFSFFSFSSQVDRPARSYRRRPSFSPCPFLFLLSRFLFGTRPAHVDEDKRVVSVVSEQMRRTARRLCGLHSATPCRAIIVLPAHVCIAGQTYESRGHAQTKHYDAALRHTPEQHTHTHACTWINLPVPGSVQHEPTSTHTSHTCTHAHTRCTETYFSFTVVFLLFLSSSLSLFVCVCHAPRWSPEKYVRITGCVLRTRVRDTERCCRVYDPPLTEGVRADRAGTRVPARLRRTSAERPPISARLLATFTVAGTLHRRVPHTCAAQTHCERCATRGPDVFHLLCVSIFPPPRHAYPSLSALHCRCVFSALLFLREGTLAICYVIPRNACSRWSPEDEFHAWRNETFFTRRGSSLGKWSFWSTRFCAFSESKMLGLYFSLASAIIFLIYKLSVEVSSWIRFVLTIIYTEHDLHLHFQPSKFSFNKENRGFHKFTLNIEHKFRHLSLLLNQNIYEAILRFWDYLLFTSFLWFFTKVEKHMYDR